MDLNSVSGQISSWILGFSGGMFPDYVVTGLNITIQLLMVIVAAYVTGRIGKLIATKLMKIVGLKKLTEKSWADNVLSITGYKGGIVELIGDLVKWLIYILFFALVLQIVGLTGVASMVGAAAGLVPVFIGAILLVVIGLIIADFFGKVFQEAGSKMLGGEDFGKFVGGLVRYTIGMAVIIMALALLGINTAALAILLSALLVTVIIITGLGIKNVMPEVTAGLQVKNTFRVGDKVKIGEHSGVIEEIGQLSTKLKSNGSAVILPNTELTTKPVEKVRKR